MLPVFVFPEEMGGRQPMIPDVSYLFFSDVLFFPFSGLIAGIGPLLLFIATSCRPYHIDAECKIQLTMCRSVAIVYTTLYHVET
jgi:hypothetical protein